MPSRGSNPGQENKWFPKNDFGWFWSTICSPMVKRKKITQSEKRFFWIFFLIGWNFVNKKNYHQYYSVASNYAHTNKCIIFIYLHVRCSAHVKVTPMWQLWNEMHALNSLEVNPIMVWKFPVCPPQTLLWHAIQKIFLIIF